MSRRSPFKYFKTSPEIIRRAVMMYIRFPLSLPLETKAPDKVEHLSTKYGAEPIAIIERLLCDRTADIGAVDCEYLIRVDSGLSVLPASASLKDRLWL